VARLSAGSSTTPAPAALADLLGHDPAGADTLALDGKSVRGSRRGTTPAAYLLAAMTVTQLRVPQKTNETTCFAALLDSFDLAGVTVTGDALQHPARSCPFPRRDQTGHGPENMATLRSFAINRLRAVGHANIAATPYDSPPPLRTTAGPGSP
jgi:hypothetical protein